MNGERDSDSSVLEYGGKELQERNGAHSAHPPGSSRRWGPCDT